MNQLGKLINRIPGSHLLIASLPGKASRTLVDIARLAKPGKLDIKRHSPSILYLSLDVQLKHEISCDVQGLH